MVNLKPIYPSIVCFGDSQTQYANGAGGFVAALGDIYQRRADVINRGFGGYTTRDAIPLARHLFSQDPAAGGSHILGVILWLGCNDSVDPGNVQCVKEEDFSKNLSQIIDYIRPSSDTKHNPFVIVIGPTPVFGLPTHNNSRKVIYNDLTKEVVEKRKDKEVVFLDAYKMFTEEKRVGLGDLMEDDGLHVSSVGYQLLTYSIFNIFKAQPKLNPNNLPLIFPSWPEIKSETVEEQMKPSVSYPIEK